MQIRQTMGAIPLLLAMGAIPAMAGTVTDTLNFTVNYGPAPTSGSFTYDTTANSFTSFLVNWDGFAFNMTAQANNPSATGVSQVPCIAGYSGAQASYMAFTSCASSDGGLEYDALGGNNDGFMAFFFAGQGGLGTPIFQLDINNIGEGPSPVAAGGFLTTNQGGNGGGGSGTPEPGTWSLLAAGLAAFAWLARRRGLAPGQHAS
jgi:hypothetical protein